MKTDHRKEKGIGKVEGRKGRRGKRQSIGKKKG
jgi:hypothetical protein